MNKQDLKNRVELLPEFELRRVKVKGDNVDDDINWIEPDHTRAVCKLGESIPYAFVGSKYDLVQFKDVFTPILDSMDVEVDGQILDYGGYASLVLFPKMDELVDGDTRFGLVAMNSVDCSSAVVVRFCIQHGDHYIQVPTKISGIKKKHSGKVKGIVKDYVQLVGSVRHLWKNIITEFPKYSVVTQVDPSKENELEFKSVMKSFNIGKKLSKALEEKYQKAYLLGKKYTLWDVFIDAIAVITERKYKSPVHQQKRIDALSELIFSYAVTLGL
jgi:hypothetical protein